MQQSTVLRRLGPAAVQGELGETEPGLPAAAGRHGRPEPGSGPAKARDAIPAKLPANQIDLAAVVGGAAPGTLMTPIDQALSPDGQFLYQLSPGNGMVVPFAIDDRSGSLTQLSPVSDGLGTGQSPQGIAAVDFN